MPLSLVEFGDHLHIMLLYLISCTAFTQGGTGKIKLDFGKCTGGIGAELTAETLFLSLKERALLIGSSVHDSTFGKAFLSQHR